tara:strand:- start:835 stop:1128 length:294 start_codon:yes stop_codon:yes gene_type:complete
MYQLPVYINDRVSFLLMHKMGIPDFFKHCFWHHKTQKIKIFKIEKSGNKINSGNLSLTCVLNSKWKVRRIFQLQHKIMGFENSNQYPDIFHIRLPFF